MGGDEEIEKATTDSAGIAKDTGADQARRGDAYSIDARGAMGVQAGDGNTQINEITHITYSHRQETGAGIDAPPAAKVSGNIRSPYRGLHSFREKDAPFFFGRDKAVSEVRERMSQLVRAPGILMVEGASGAGKSSLLEAGVLPRLRSEGLGFAPRAASWPWVLLVPGRKPLDQLALKAAHLTGTDAGAVRQRLGDDPEEFALTVRQAVLEHSSRSEVELGSLAARDQGELRLMLVVDQFEQVFTQCEDAEERRAFITALYAAAHGRDGTPPALVVLGMRSDFDGRCAEYPELADAAQNRYLVMPMDEAELLSAITEPARISGSRVEAELSNRLLDEVRVRQPGSTGAGVLPLLSHALDKAWRARSARNLLTLADYVRTDGIREAVARSAGSVYDSLAPGEQEAARRVFTRLVATSADGVDTADSSTRDELIVGHDASEAAAVNGVLEAFTAERLLTLDEGGVKISHEALLTEWPLLRNWLDDTHADRVVRTRLRATAEEWDQRSRDQSFLYRGTLLQAANETAGRVAADPVRNPPLNRDEQDFLRASQQASRRSVKRRQAALATLSVLFLIVGGLALLANHQTTEVAHQRDKAIAGQVEAESDQLSSANPSLAAQLLYSAYRIAPDQEIEERLIGTENQPLSSTPYATRGGGEVDSVAFSPDRRTLAIGGADGKVTLWNVVNPAHPAMLGHPLAFKGGDGVDSVAFSPDGRTLAAGEIGLNSGGRVTLWNVADPAHPKTLGHLPVKDGSSVNSVAFSPDGRSLAVGDDGSHIGASVSGQVTLWNVANPAHPAMLGNPLPVKDGGSVKSVVFSRGGRTLAAGDSIDVNSGGQVTLWNVANPARPQMLGNPLSLKDGGSVYSVAFSPDNRTLAVGDDGNGGQGGGVTLWNVVNPARPKAFGNSFGASSNNNVDSVAFSPDGRTLAVGYEAEGSNDGNIHSASGQVTLWNVINPAQPAMLDHPLGASDGGRVISVAFSGDSRTLIAGGDKVTQWDLPPAIFLPDIKEPVHSASSLAFSPDGSILAVGDNDSSGGVKVTLWNTTNPARPAILGQPLPIKDGGSVHSVAFSPDGHTLAVGDESEVSLWSITDPAQPKMLHAPFTAIPAPSFDAGGSTMVNTVAFSRDGRTLAAGGGGTDTGTDGSGGGGDVALWNVANPAHPRMSKHPLATSNGNAVNTVAFSPDGRTLAMGDDSGIGENASDSSGQVTLWNIANPDRPAALGHSFAASGGESVSSVAFGQDGRTLAAGGDYGHVMLWNVARPKRPAALGHTFGTSGSGSVGMVAFGTYGRTLAVSSLSSNGSGEVTLWNIADPAHPTTLGQPLATSNSTAAFSLRHGVLTTDGSGNTVQLWNMNVHYAISRICRSNSGVLTAPLWSQYVPQPTYDPPCRNG